MEKYFNVDRISTYLKIIISLVLYLSVKDTSKVISFSTLAVAILEYIIILELVRMLIEFMFTDENRIKLRYMIDSTIIFFIRDIMLIVSEKFDFEKILSILAIIGILFVFRGLTIKFSPSNYK